ncbi:hypothetical protein WJX74_005315 [Apatococcus lobatus]|uniref:Uncharacterized protein n=1 Tax=Apatococcus lobatus TaxID=904363 RepID=A0AAW1S3M0_9CHLO
MGKSLKNSQLRSPPKQANLKELFSKKHSKSADGKLEALVACEVPWPAQSDIQIRTTNSSLKYSHECYGEAMGSKRKHARLGNVRNVRARRDTNQADGLSAETDPMQHGESLRSGDVDGLAFIGQLQEFLELNSCLSADHLKAAIEMLRQHGLHDSAELLLMEHLRMTPISKAANSAEGAPQLHANQASWNIMGMRRYPKDVCVEYLPDQISRGDHEVTEFGLLKRLVSVASLACQGWHVDVARQKDLVGMTPKQGHGELLLLKFIVAGLQQDLRARLAIYTALSKASSGGAGTASSKKSMLLQGSVLWRLLSAGNIRHDDTVPVIRNLVEVITGDGSPPASCSRTPSKTPPKKPASGIGLPQDEAGESLQEGQLWTQPALAEIASMLLNLLYDLCGHMEEDGLAFHNKRPGGSQHSVYREELDKHVAGMLKGGNVVSKDTSRIYALLLSLPARDCLRLIAVLIGRPHIRKDRAIRFNSLEVLHNVTYDRPSETTRYTSASVLDILGYLTDEAARGNMTKVLASEMGSDAQAVLIAASVQATLRCLRNGQLRHCFIEPLPFSKEEALITLQTAFEEASEACFERNMEALTPEAKALIIGCRACLKAAAAALC